MHLRIMLVYKFAHLFIQWFANYQWNSLLCIGIIPFQTFPTVLFVLVAVNLDNIAQIFNMLPVFYFACMGDSHAQTQKQI